MESQSFNRQASGCSVRPVGLFSCCRAVDTTSWPAAIAGWRPAGHVIYGLKAVAMIVTIDGPAGAGKSSISRRLAERLGFAFLDTGAMYRAVALAALRRGLGADRADAIARLAGELTIDFDGVHTLLDGEDVSRAIRTSDVSAVVYLAADNQPVRGRLVELQRKIAQGRDIVTEGRDQGTVAFPNAQCKIFLTASREERARRRYEELISRGEPITFAEILAQQDERD